MNDPLTEKLVDLYANHGAEHAGTRPELLALVDRHGEDTAFDSAVNRASTVARTLEEQLDGRLHARQVTQALKAFNSYKKDTGRQDICRELTRRRYAPHWSQEQRRYYEAASEKLLAHDYFLSFTNHTPRKGAVMVVNREHMALLRTGLARPIKPPETVERNLLAELLDLELCNGPLHGYYYPDERGADDVEATMIEQAQQAFVFVQLVENTMFAKRPNYCLNEFKAACADATRKMIFVMPIPLSEFVKKEDVDNSMHEWHTAIRKPDVVELEPVSTPARAREVLHKIKRGVVQPVKDARSELYENVPE